MQDKLKALVEANAQEEMGKRFTKSRTSNHDNTFKDKRLSKSRTSQNGTIRDKPPNELTDEDFGFRPDGM